MVTSPFRYAGAKNKLTNIILTYLKNIQTSSNYLEPFFGGGSVGLAIAEKYPNINLYLNDKDKWIATFWQVICDSNKIKDLFCLLEQPVTIEQFNKLNAIKAISDIDIAYKSLFYNRTCFSGIVKRDSFDFVTSSPIGGKEQKSEYKIDCRFNLKKIKEKILYCNKILSGRTTISNLDVNDFLSLNDKDPMYLDPPYVEMGKSLYSVYMDLNEHKKLSEKLSIRNNWVLSYDNSDLIKEFYKNCSIYDTSCFYSIKGSKKEWSKKTELIIVPK